jgi:hypothetical protein
MDAFAAELKACLGRAHVHDTSPTVVLRSPVVHRPPNRLAGLAAFWAVAFLAVASVLAGMYLPGGDKKRAVAASTHSTKVATRRPASATAPKLVTVPVKAVAAYDPSPGDGTEDDGALSLATDGDPSTAWSTETYATAGFGNLKHGVGIVLDAGKNAAIGSLTLQSDTPGFRAEVLAGPSPDGTFRPVSKQATVGGRTTFPLTPRTRARYLLVWITSLAPGSGPKFRADVNRVTARGPLSQR